MENFIHGVAFGMGFAIVSSLADYLKYKLKPKRTKAKKVPMLKLVKRQ